MESTLAVPLTALYGFGFGSTPWQPVQDNPDQVDVVSPDPVELLSPADQRRVRRMISNRESARRSRMRKQLHLEELRCQASRLRAENRDLASRLGAVSHFSSLFHRHNDRLRAESSALRSRLSDIRRILVLRQLQRLSSQPACGGFGFHNESNTNK